MVIIMSNPADIEVAGDTSWLSEDSTPVVTATVVSESPAGNNVADNGWLVDDSAGTTSPSRTSAGTRSPPRTPNPDDNIIYAPSRATRSPTTSDSGGNRFSNMISNARNYTKKSKEESKKSSSNEPDSNETPNVMTRGTVINANIETGVNVNNGGDNNGRTSAAEAAAQKTWGEFFRESFQRDGRLFLVIIGILIIMNIPLIWWVLYPFIVFSTWIHELCHGMAAVMLGGKILTLEIFPDGSGYATSMIPNIDRRAFVSSAGYQGTAVIGFLLLIFRRTKRGPRTGTMVLACTMMLSCILWVRNWFGFVFVFCFGVVLAGLAWKLPSFHIRNLYVILAATVALNAISHVRALFGGNYYVNGAPVQTDAHTMGDETGTSYLVWAVLWLILAILMTILGILFAIPGPDEVADFQCCGICQDAGCFKLCNYPGQRWLSRWYGGESGSTSGQDNSTATTNTTNNNSDSAQP